MRGQSLAEISYMPFVVINYIISCQTETLSHDQLYRGFAGGIPESRELGYSHVMSG